MAYPHKLRVLGTKLWLLFAIRNWTSSLSARVVRAFLFLAFAVACFLRSQSRKTLRNLPRKIESGKSNSSLARWRRLLIFGDFQVQEVSEGQAKLDAWTLARCMLRETGHGLELDIMLGREQRIVKLISWNADAPAQFEIEELPEEECSDIEATDSEGFSETTESEAFTEDETNIFSGINSANIAEPIPRRTSLRSEASSTESVKFRRRISIHTIPSQDIAPTALHYFSISYPASRNSIAIGCKEKASCKRWVRTLKPYCSISRRYRCSFLWKLSTTVTTNLPKDSSAQNALPDPHNAFADLRHWRRRLCYLEVLHLDGKETLCLVYSSEKQDAERVVTPLMYAGENIASLRKLDTIVVKSMSTAKEDHIKTRLFQYNVDVMGFKPRDAIDLPTLLHSFMVESRSTCMSDSHPAHSSLIFACEDREALVEWMASFQDACEEMALKRYMQ